MNIKMQFSKYKISYSNFEICSYVIKEKQWSVLQVSQHFIQITQFEGQDGNNLVSYRNTCIFIGANNKTSINSLKKKSFFLDRQLLLFLDRQLVPGLNIGQLFHKIRKILPRVYGLPTHRHLTPWERHDALLFANQTGGYVNSAVWKAGHTSTGNQALAFPALFDWLGVVVLSHLKGVRTSLTTISDKALSFVKCTYFLVCQQYITTLVHSNFRKTWSDLSWLS